MRVLVTGAGGFLGAAVCRMLLARGDEVVGLNRGSYRELEDLGVQMHRGDIANAATVDDALRGCDAVIHVAAKAGVWGTADSYRSANVVGTENVIASCRRYGVGRLVHTSTPSVVHGGHDVEGVDESAPYAVRYQTHYPATKAEAERAVLSAAGSGLLTVALRPHLIWGPGDNHLVPRIVDRARRGRLAFVGDGTNLVDSVYIDNAAEAHLLALDALEVGAPCVGRAYFVTNDEPLPIKDLINRIVGAAGLAPVHRHVNPTVAWVVGAVLEGVYGALGRADEPPMTRFVARQLATAHHYDIGAARRDLRYTPRVSIDEGIERLRASFSARRLS